MSMALMGITHCPKCGRVYEEMSFTCKYCEDKKKEKQEKILNLFSDMTDYEINALLVLVKEKARELKKQDLKAQIKELENELKEV